MKTPLSITDPKPVDVTQADVAFPANVKHLMPDYDALNAMRNERGRPLWDFNSQHPMCKIAGQWFGRGLPDGTKFIPKEGINQRAALLHLHCILGSFEPSHEHKMATIAFLLDAWFEKIEIPNV